MLEFFKRFIQAFKRRSVQSIEFDEQEVSLCWNGNKYQTSQWKDIREIVCFKRDLYSVDQLSMLIQSNNEKPFELDENMPGWQAFVAELHTHLPGCLTFTDWFMYVAFPAFETKPLWIYKRGEVVTLPGQKCVE